MLPAYHTTATVLRQCSKHILSGTSFAHRFRLLSTESSPSPPDWVNLETPWNHRRNEWNRLMKATSTHSTKHAPEENTPEFIWDSWERSHVAHLLRPHTPYTGRSVPVVKGDLQTALVKLKGILSINAVRYSHIRDERHEKKGEKRNRLKSQRWRRRFAHEVRKKVQLVNEIRARGA